MIRSLHVYTKSQGAKQTHQFKGCANKYYNIITDKTAQNNLKLDFQKKIEVRVKQVKQHLFRLGDNVKILSQILLTAMYMHLSNTKPFPPKLGLKQRRENYVEHPPETISSKCCVSVILHYRVIPLSLGSADHFLPDSYMWCACVRCVWMNILVF